MEQINLGSLPNGAGGDSIRVGFQKCNDNFTELTGKVGSGSDEELKQIKKAAAELTERVAKLEKAGGNAAPSGELAELKKQLQQLQTKLTEAEKVATAAAGKADSASQAATNADRTAQTASQAAQTAGNTAAAAKLSTETLEREVAELKKLLAKTGTGDGLFVGKIELLSTTADAMPAKWYLATGDKYPENSPQGKALKSLPEPYKRAFKIELKNGQINTPNLFHTDGRGYFLRPSKTLGEVQSDTLAKHYHVTGLGATDNDDIWLPRDPSLGNKGIPTGNPMYVTCGMVNQVNTPPKVASADWTENHTGLATTITMDTPKQNPGANGENRPLNIGFTPAIYLGV
ncbi:hypothetical protein [Eikenella exigua]|uniref:Phage tail collar domain-containing protein n=1 Tax=Eikenella exigua TaxID=2528037 RepID=A0AAX1F9R2_9NEIS|nr:hypothetical protein [Eikenella exigua]QED92841.1 hypothetical protein EZJ17_09665 [Eikenella exigua]